MNKFVMWFHNRSKPIQAVIKLLFTIAFVAACLAGVVLLFLIPAWVVYLAFGVFLLVLIYWGVTSWFEQH